MFKLFLRILQTAVATPWSRARRGPMRPSWSFGYEALARVLKRNAVDMARLEPAQRRGILERLARASVLPLRGQVDRRPGDIGSVPGEWFLPRGRTPARTILFFHGGAYIIGSSATHADMLMRLAVLAEARVFCPHYRLAPEHPFPASIDDGFAVYRALLEQVAEPGRRLALAGDSAGGNLALVTLLRAREAGLAMPAAAALISPWVDLAAEGGSLVSNAAFDWAEPEDFRAWSDVYLQGASASQPHASPVRGDLRGLPPLWLEVGTAEMLLDQVRELERRLREAGTDLAYHELPDRVHDSFMLAAMLPECRQLAANVAAFLKSRTAE